MSSEKTQEEEEEDDEEEEEEEEASGSTDEEDKGDEDDSKVDTEDGAEGSAGEAAVQGSTEERPAERPVEEPIDPETLAKIQKTREKDVHMFMVLTVHRILNKTGTLSCLNEVVTAAHIKRLVELTLNRFRPSEDLGPHMEKHRLVAKGVIKELKKTFVGKVRCMLLLPDPSVEHVIAACIQTHLEKALTEEPKPLWKRLFSSIFS